MSKNGSAKPESMESIDRERIVVVTYDEETNDEHKFKEETETGTFKDPNTPNRLSKEMGGRRRNDISSGLLWLAGNGGPRMLPLGIIRPR